MDERKYGSILLTKAIDNYLQDKSIKNDCSIIILKLLIAIYGEINIINPYYSLNTTKLIENMAIYGYPPHKIEDFFDMLNVLNKDLDNRYQKKTSILDKVFVVLIDMIFCKNKKTKITEVEFKYFESLICFESSKNIFIKVFDTLFNTNKGNIEYYWKVKLFELTNPIKLEEENYLLAQNVYEKYGINYELVKRMSKNQVLELNKKIVEDETSSSVDGGRTKTNDRVKILTYSSGNAIIDSLLLVGFVSTQLLVIYLVAIKLYGG